MFFSSKPTPATPPPPSETPVRLADGDSDSLKKAIMKQILIESNTNHAKLMIEKMDGSCFEKCAPKAGGVMTSNDDACVVQCVDKYLAAWNHVHAAYLRRVQQEVEKSAS